MDFREPSAFVRKFSLAAQVDLIPVRGLGLEKTSLILIALYRRGLSVWLEGNKERHQPRMSPSIIRVRVVRPECPGPMTSRRLQRESQQ